MKTVLWSHGLFIILIVTLLTGGCRARTQSDGRAETGDEPRIVKPETQAIGEAKPTYKESPILKARVEAGELPPVEERLPKEPLVVQPVENVGRYGGKIGN